MNRKSRIGDKTPSGPSMQESFEPHSSATISAGPRGGLLLVLALSIACALGMISVTAINVALPEVGQRLSISVRGLVWVVDAYTLTFAALLLAGGALADRFGPKAVYQVGLALFTFASVLCAVASDATPLIAARLLQGAGAALFMPSSLSLLALACDDDASRAKVFGLWTAIVGTSAAIGPLVGGVLVHQFGWRGVFWINLPLGAIGLLFAHVLVRTAMGHRRPLSVASHVLGVGSLAGLTFVLIEAPARGWLSHDIVLAASVSIIAALGLAKLQRGGAHPLLPVALWKAHGFATINVVGFLVNFGTFGQIFFLGLYLREANSASALRAGLLLLPTMATFSVGNLISGALSSRLGPRKPMLLGLGGAALCGLAMMALPTQSAGYVLLVLGASILNLTSGITVPAMTTAMMNIAAHTHTNSAAAALNANRQIGALMGVAVVGAILQVASDWNVRLSATYAVIGTAYAAAFIVVRVFLPKPVARTAVA